MTSTLPNDNIKNFDEQITNKLISEIIRDRIKSKGTRFSANDNIADFINPGELKVLEKEVASRIKDLLKSLIISEINLLVICSSKFLILSLGNVEVINSKQEIVCKLN